MFARRLAVEPAWADVLPAHGGLDLAVDHLGVLQHLVEVLLVQRLRTTEASAYTKRDTPTFTCVAMSVERALNALDGAALHVTA